MHDFLARFSFTKVSSHYLLVYGGMGEISEIFID